MRREPGLTKGSGDVVTGPTGGNRKQGHDTGPVRVAQYLRMSTDHQQYSTDNQAEAITRYAEQHGMVIVRTYADEGKSGLDIGWRPGL